MSKAIDKKFEQFISEIMTAYRWIPLLSSLVTRGESEFGDTAWDELTDEVYRRFPNESHEKLDGLLANFLVNQDDWIYYSMADLRFYLDNLPHVCDFLTYYLGMMDDKAKFFDWRNSAFKFKFPKVLIDIGCGRMSFAKLFAENNLTLIKYIGIDKRDVTGHFRELSIPIQNCSFIHKDFLKILSKEEELVLSRGPDVLFFGQILHCIPHPISFVEHTVTLFETVNQIKILEPKDEKLSTAFGFHMSVHSGGARITPESISLLAQVLKWIWRQEAASSQHTMYTLTKP